jgi:hypothetical protein
MSNSTAKSFLTSAIPSKVTNQSNIEGAMRKCKCPSEINYPNLTIYSDRLSFNITPSSYILGSYNNKVCMLGIETLPDETTDLLILGDIFFHHQIVIFDKESNQIGFVSNHKIINIFPSSNLLVWIMKAMNIFAFVVVLFILGLRKKRAGNSLLQEPLRIGGSVEMASS